MTHIYYVNICCTQFCASDIFLWKMAPFPKTMTQMSLIYKFKGYISVMHKICGLLTKPLFHIIKHHIPFLYFFWQNKKKPFFRTGDLTTRNPFLRSNLHALGFKTKASGTSGFCCVHIIHLNNNKTILSFYSDTSQQTCTVDEASSGIFVAANIQTHGD